MCASVEKSGLVLGPRGSGHHLHLWFIFINQPWNSVLEAMYIARELNSLPPIPYLEPDPEQESRCSYIFVFMTEIKKSSSPDYCENIP